MHTWKRLIIGLWNPSKSPREGVNGFTGIKIACVKRHFIFIVAEYATGFKFPLK